MQGVKNMADLQLEQPTTKQETYLYFICKRLEAIEHFLKQEDKNKYDLPKIEVFNEVVESKNVVLSEAKPQRKKK